MSQQPAIRQPMSARDGRPLPEKLQQMLSKLQALSAEVADHRQEVQQRFSDLASLVETGGQDHETLKQAFEELELKVIRASELSCDVYDQQVENQTQYDRRFHVMQEALAELRAVADSNKRNGKWQDSIKKLYEDLHSVFDRLRGELLGLSQNFLPVCEDASSSTANFSIEGRGASVVCRSELVQFMDVFLRNLCQSLDARLSGCLLDEVEDVKDFTFMSDSHRSNVAESGAALSIGGRSLEITEQLKTTEQIAKKCHASLSSAIIQARESACEKIEEVAQETCTRIDQHIRASLACSSRVSIDEASSHRKLPSEHADSEEPSLLFLDRIRLEVAAQLESKVGRSVSRDNAIRAADQGANTLDIRSETQETRRELIEATEALRAIGLEMCESQDRAKHEVRLESERVSASMALQRSLLSEEISSLSLRVDAEGKSRRPSTKDAKTNCLDIMAQEIAIGKKCHEELASAFHAAMAETGAIHRSVLDEVHQHQSELRALHCESLLCFKSTNREDEIVDYSMGISRISESCNRPSFEEEQTLQAVSRRYAAYAAVTQRVRAGIGTDVEGASRDSTEMQESGVVSSNSSSGKLLLPFSLAGSIHLNTSAITSPRHSSPTHNSPAASSHLLGGNIVRYPFGTIGAPLRNPSPVTTARASSPLAKPRWNNEDCTEIPSSWYSRFVVVEHTLSHGNGEDPLFPRRMVCSPEDVRSFASRIANSFVGHCLGIVQWDLARFLSCH